MGGIRCQGSGTIDIVRSIISENDGDTGGVHCDTVSPTLTNCVISQNTGNLYPGVGITNAASPTITNCTIADNTGTNAGGIRCSPAASGAPTILNNILWGNNAPQVDCTGATVTYSDVQGGHAGTGNINANPAFAGPGDYHISLASPCVDVANAAGAPADDKDGNVRPQGAGFDMGAYENMPDEDGDGVPSMYEMGPDGDPTYDGNNDGTPDWMQGNVSSFPTVDGGNYVTIDCSAGSFSNTGPVPNPAPSNSPEGVTFPFGFFSFVINDLPTGGAATVTIYLSGEAPEDYWKFGRTPADPANHWYLFNTEEDADGHVTGADKTGDTVITLYLVDGKRGDNDLTPNGTITDPGAPAVGTLLIPDYQDNSDSTCFVGTAADSFGF